MMTAAMLETLKAAGIANEWHKGDMHRLYIDLIKADKLYSSNNADLEHARLILNRYERSNGKMWIDLGSGKICTKNIGDSEAVISQIMELVNYLTPADTNEHTTDIDPEHAAPAEKEDTMTDTINLRLEVRNLNSRLEAITLLYNAAAKCYELHGDPMYDAIKAQEAQLTAYCEAEKERLADIIRTTGTMTASNAVMELMGTKMSCRIYEYGGEEYRIATDIDGNIEEIVSLTDEANERAYNDHLRECTEIIDKRGEKYDI